MGVASRRMSALIRGTLAKFGTMPLFAPCGKGRAFRAANPAFGWRLSPACHGFASVDARQTGRADHPHPALITVANLRAPLFVARRFQAALRLDTGTQLQIGDPCRMTPSQRDVSNGEQVPKQPPPVVKSRVARNAPYAVGDEVA